MRIADAKTVGLLAFLGALALAAGCATPPPGLLAGDPEVAALTRDRTPLPYSVLLGAVRLEEPTGYPEPGVHRIPVRPDQARDVARRALEESRIFSNSLFPREPGRTREELLTEARDRGADLLLELEVRGVECTHAGPNSLWLPNVVLWLTLWAPSLWVADQTYTVEADAAYEVRNTQDGEVVFQGDVHAEVDVDLDYFDRDVKWWGLLRLEDGEPNWEAIIDRVRPHALYQIEKRLVLSLLGELDPVARRPEFHAVVYPVPSAAREVAISIGVSDYRHASLQGRCQFAEEDAANFVKFLDRREEPLGEGAVDLLVGESTTKEKIWKAFFKLASAGTQHRDRISVYFSGVGASERRPDGKWDFYILPGDADPLDLPRSAISLRELGEWLSGANADEIWVVIDAGFGSVLPGKGIHKAHSPEAEELEAFRRMVREVLPGRGRALILAGRPGDSVSELEFDRQGLMTYYLFKYFGPKGDENRDGRVTLGEAGKLLSEAVDQNARQQNGMQIPVIFGDEDLVIWNR